MHILKHNPIYFLQAIYIHLYYINNLFTRKKGINTYTDYSVILFNF